MAGKKEKRLKKQKKTSETTVKEPTPSAEVQGEKPFEFGGLPDRDLKKGMGCGG